MSDLILEAPPRSGESIEDLADAIREILGLAEMGLREEASAQYEFKQATHKWLVHRVDADSSSQKFLLALVERSPNVAHSPF